MSPSGVEMATILKQSAESNPKEDPSGMPEIPNGWQLLKQGFRRIHLARTPPIPCTSPSLAPACFDGFQHFHDHDAAVAIGRDWFQNGA